MVVKRFFFVSAGLLCIVLAYHLGATGVTAAGLPVEGAQFEFDSGSNAYLSFSTNRAVYGFTRAVGGSAYAPLPAPSQPVPGTDDIVATHIRPAGDGGDYLVVLANGDAYYAPYGSNTWTYDGNLVGGVPTHADTWGGLKTHYR